MDRLDSRILSALAADSARPVAELARELGLARSTVQARIRRLEERGIIAGYTIRLGEGHAAQRIRATVLLRIAPQANAAVIGRLRAIAQIERCNSTSGRFDMILQIAAETTAELDSLLDRIGAIEGVAETETLVHLSTKFDRAP